MHSANLENLTTGCDMRRADAGWDDHHYHDKSTGWADRLSVEITKDQWAQKKLSWQKYDKYKYNGSDYGGDVADDDGAACEGQ